MEYLLHPFIRYMQRLIDINEHDAGRIIERTHEMFFSKGDIILKEGTVARFAYFIIEGQARSYYTDNNGNTVTWLFHFNESFANAKNLFITDYKSFLSGAPGTLTIEALTDLTLVQFSQENISFLEAHVPAFEWWMRRLNEQFFSIIYDRIFSLLTMSASERYIKLTREESHLQQMFSNHFVSSYLNIAPQSLSRIKRQLLLSQHEVKE